MRSPVVDNAQLLKAMDQFGADSGLTQLEVIKFAVQIMLEEQGYLSKPRMVRRHEQAGRTQH